MKKLMLLIYYGLFTGFVYAQSTVEILKTPEEKTPVYQPKITSGKQLNLRMDYGCPVIANPNDIKVLKNAQIAAVDIVYSDDPAGVPFITLTKNRIAQLKKLKPDLFSNPEITWRFVRQTNCANEEQARKLFHGISITYRPAPTPETMKAEVDYLKDLLAPKSSVIISHDKTENIEQLIEAEKEYLDKSGYTSVIRKDSSDHSASIKCATKISGTFIFVDPSVSAALSRNKWNDMCIVADVTGSMSPYTAQLFVWLRLNTIDKKVKQFVFFNDGDETPDHKKIIGNTGGIYQTRSSVFADVENLAYTAMMKGGGGDCPENNIEALLLAQETCSDCKEIILIADNWAPIKDISLAGKIKKPVRVILCGTDYGINVQYLNFARATGGSIHTMHDDLINLTNLNEGETIDIRGKTFKIEKGTFVPVVKI